MAKKVLYYPYIHVPETPWFTRTLLYWDVVGSIVPGDYLHQPHLLGPYMRELVREGLVQQVVPGMYLGSVPDFADTFLSHLDSRPDDANCDNPATGFRVHAESLGSSSIHMEKLQGLGQHLEERGLAHRSREDHSPNLSHVEPGVAREFMSYLAMVLGQVADGGEFVPITDDKLHLVGAESDHNARRAETRTFLLSEILPAPVDNISPARIAEFKARYATELRHFRESLEEEVSQVCCIQDPRDRMDRAKDVAARLRDGRDTLADAMSAQRGWSRIGYTDLVALAGGAIVVHEAGGAEHPAVAVTGSALSVAPLVVRALRGRTKELRSRPLAYASLATAKLR